MDGSTWALQTTPNPAGVDGPKGTNNSPLNGVSCATASNCWAVGNYDTGNHNNDFLTLAEQWTGKSWSLQPVASPVGASYSQLSAVSCASTRFCMSVGFSSRSNVATGSFGPDVALAELHVATEDQ